MEGATIKNCDLGGNELEVGYDNFNPEVATMEHLQKAAAVAAICSACFAFLMVMKVYGGSCRKRKAPPLGGAFALVVGEATDAIAHRLFVQKIQLERYVASAGGLGGRICRSAVMTIAVRVSNAVRIGAECQILSRRCFNGPHGCFLK